MLKNKIDKLMKFSKIESIQHKTKTQLSSFEKGENTVSEYMVMMHITNVQLSFNMQLNDIISEFKRLLNDDLYGTKPVFMRFFLSDTTNQSRLVLESLKDVPQCAVSIVEQPPLDGTKIALWVYLQSNVSVKALKGNMFAVENGDYTHYWTSSANCNNGDSHQQMKELFDNYVNQLESQNCTLSENCIRTWLFVQNVDVNYSGVVKARNEVFDKQNLTNETHFISSTGIQGRSADYHSLVQMETYAVKGIKPEQIQFLYAQTHLNRTNEYGVRFERGTCVHYSDHRQVFISGTASINNKGEVMYVSDIKQQTLRMWENVETLLKEAECTFDNVAQMIVYLRDISDYHLVAQMFEEKFQNMPKVIVYAPVCRPTWLIEMECIAIK